MYVKIAGMLKDNLTPAQIIKFLPVILETVTMVTSKENKRFSPESAIKIQTLIEKLRNGDDA